MIVIPVEWADPLAAFIEGLLDGSEPFDGREEVAAALVAEYRDNTGAIADQLLSAPGAASPPQADRVPGAPVPPAPSPDPAIVPAGPVLASDVMRQVVDEHLPAAAPSHGHRRRTAEAERNLLAAVAQAKRYLTEPRSPAELREHLGFGPRGDKRATRVLALLADDPDVEATGNTKSRRYALSDAARRRQQNAIRKAGESADGSAGRTYMTGPTSSARQEPTLDGRILGRCSGLSAYPTRAELHRDLAGVPADQIDDRVRTLIDEGLLTYDGTGMYPRYRALAV